MKTAINSIDEYIAQYPLDVQQKLTEIRVLINQLAPMAIEKISYGMPTFHHIQNLVYFAAYKNHIGFYPHSEAIVVFAEDLKNYKTSKGAIQFPIDKKVPMSLIKKIVLFRLKAVESLKKKK